MARIIASSQEVAVSDRLIARVVALCLGLFIVGSVGFANMDVVHNAAHDYRHSMGFPCH